MSGLSWFSLSFPPDLTSEQAEAFLRGLSARRMFRMVRKPTPLVVEALGRDGQISWRVGLPERTSPALLASLRSIAPGVRAVPTTHDGYDVDYGWELRMAHPFIPLRTDVATQTSGALAHSLTQARGSQRLILQWVVGGAVLRKREKLTSDSRQPSDALTMLSDAVVDRDDVAALKAKQQEPVFATLGRIAVGGASRVRSRELAARVFGALEISRSPGSGFRRRLMSGAMVARRMRSFVVPFGAWPCPLNASELTAVIGWPYEGPVLGGVQYRSQRQLPASASVLRPVGARTSGRVVAEATFPGREGWLEQHPTDSLLHTWTLGPSGQGKSTLLGNIVLQDIAQGRGVICIDPRGDLIRDVLARLDPRRLDDVVILDAGDRVAPVGINPLVGQSAEVAADTLLSVLKGLFGDNFGPRTADIVHAGVLTLAHDPNASLVNLPILLSDPLYQRRLIPKASTADPWGLKPFWAWYTSLSDDHRAAVLGPVMNKLRGLLLRGSLRRVLGQSSPRFQLQQVFTERRILLVSLASATVGSEGAALLGSVLLGMIWQTIQSRSSVAPERRHPVGLVVDEFQTYLHLPTDFADVLAQARGLGVGVVAAHQHLGQLTPSVRAALLANAQSRVLFRLSAEDAGVMAKTSRLLTAADIEGLDRYEAYVSLVSDSAVSPYASARTLPLPAAVRDWKVIQERSRARWGVPVGEIDAAHRALIEPPERRDDAVGSRRRSGESS